jgi:hypothetical protein
VVALQPARRLSAPLSSDPGREPGHVVRGPVISPTSLTSGVDAPGAPRIRRFRRARTSVRSVRRTCPSRTTRSCRSSSR